VDSLHPLSRFALVLKDGRRVPLAWDFAAMFAEEEARRRGKKISIVLTLFCMTRSAENPPGLEEIREAALELGRGDKLLLLLRAMGATRNLAFTGGLPVPKTEAKADSEAADWRRVMLQGAQFLGISTAEFWRMTPFEFQLRVEAAGKARESDRRFSAAMTANLINAAGRLKHPIGVDDLIGTSSPASANLSDEERGAMVDRAIEKVERLRREGKLKERPVEQPAVVNGEQTTQTQA
jgi:hypothetical protein